MNIKSTIVPYQQGTEEWAQHRARSLNASELAAAMGISPYLSRADLIKQKATGIGQEVDAATQRRFDKGHEVEAAARPLAEEVVGEDLYTGVFAAEVDGLHLSASLDGHTLLNEVTWEHKLAGADLIASLQSRVIPEQYHPQMEQGLMLTGATRCLFTASNGTRESAVHVWYESNPELRAKIVPTWKQFMADVAAYVPTTAEAPKPTGRAPETLPALRIEVTGMVTASNLEEFKSQAMSVFQGISRDLQTDEDFANAEATVKWAKGIEDRLASAKESALAQTESIDTLFRAIDDISAEARRVRLDLDKLVKARKEAIKADIVAEGIAAMAKHIRELHAAMPGNYMPTVPADFGGAIKGLRTVDSIRNAVNTELARAKIAANEIADRIQINLATLRELAGQHAFLFADTAAIVLKAPDDLTTLVKARIAEHAAQEAARIEAERQRIQQDEERKAREAAERQAEAERQRIRAEEQHKAQMEVAEKLKAEQAAERQANEDRGRIEAHAAQQQSEAALAAVAERARLDTDPRFAAVVASAPAPADETPTLTLGVINERLHPISVSAAGLAEFGIEPLATKKAAKLYSQSQFEQLCRAIVRCATDALRGEMEAA